MTSTLEKQGVGFLVRGKMKKCSKCGKVKLLSEFSKNNWSKQGITSQCKKCRSINMRKWQIANPDKMRDATYRYRNSHPEKVREINRKSNIKWLATNLEKARASTRRWIHAHPEKNLEKVRNRRARKLSNGGKITNQQWEALKAKYNYMCLCCKRREPEIKLTLDHVKPLFLGGKNTIRNSQPLCHSCNSRKGIKYIDYR